MNKGLWELAAVLFVFGVLCYGAWTVRGWLGELFFIFMALILLCFLLLAAIEIRHWHRKRELEYRQMSYIVHTETKVVESDDQVAMIEAPRQHYNDWGYTQEFADMQLPQPEPPTTSVHLRPEPEPIQLVTKQLHAKDSTMERAKSAYHAGANNREKMASALGVPNRKARELIAKIKGEGK